MNEKVIIFGAGKRLENLMDFMYGCNSYDIIEIWDNNEEKIGKIYNFKGRQLIIKRPHFQKEYNIIVSTNIHYEEIKAQLINKIGIPKNLIKTNSYANNKLKYEILNRYSGSKDKEIINICNYLKNNELDVFCGQINNEYPMHLFDIFKDSENGLLYSYWKGKKIYLSSKFKDENAAKIYLCSLRKEQDSQSPHCYNINELDIDNTDLVIDGGAAEGFFALEIVDKVEKVYLLECDIDWIEALRCTFKPYEDKVCIIPKFLDEFDSDEDVSLDTLVFKEKQLSKVLIKLDIEGKETDVIKGTKKLMQSDIDMTCIVCTYHKSNDAKIIYDFFDKNGFSNKFTNGYMFFPYSNDIKPELRKGVLTARRKG